MYPSQRSNPKLSWQEKALVCPNASPTRYKNLPAKIPAKDSTEAAVLLTVTYANTTGCQLCLVIFLFPKQLGHKVFNCCYYSSLDRSRFLILEKYLSHCLLSQHERRVSCGSYCIFCFFVFPLWVMHWLFFFSALARVTNPRPTWNTYSQGKITIKWKVRKGGRAPAWMLFNWNTTLSQKRWSLSPEKVKSIRLKVCNCRLDFADWIL